MEIALSCLLLWLSSFLNIGFHSNPREAVFAVRITFVSGGGGEGMVCREPSLGTVMSYFLGHVSQLIRLQSFMQ